MNEGCWSLTTHCRDVSIMSSLVPSSFWSSLVPRPVYLIIISSWAELSALLLERIFVLEILVTHTLRCVCSLVVCCNFIRKRGDWFCSIGISTKNMSQSRFQGREVWPASELETRLRNQLLNKWWTTKSFCRKGYHSNRQKCPAGDRAAEFLGGHSPILELSRLEAPAAELRYSQADQTFPTRNSCNILLL